MTEITKMKQGMSYTCKEKTIILNVFKYFRQQHSEKCITELVRCTSQATGCSEKSIFQFRKEEASGEGFKVPSSTKIRRHININSRDIKYDTKVRQTIRNLIYNLKRKDIVPSLSAILKEVNADSSLPNFSLMTLRRLVFDMGFYYEKQGNKSVLVEKNDNVSKIVPKRTNKLRNKVEMSGTNKYDKIGGASVSASAQQHYNTYNRDVPQYQNQGIGVLVNPKITQYTFQNTHIKPPVPQWIHPSD